jgi:6-pyruvoyltetrahydropterin/6-carboxytetrahydropterin synthase
MNYTITTETTFSAAHYLRGYQGDCSRLHGHNWNVEVSVTSSKLDENGFAIDFLALEDLLEKAVAPFEHRNLNEVPPFDIENPTAENIAAYVFETMSGSIQEFSQEALVIGVTVWEVGKCRATFGRN